MLQVVGALVTHTGHYITAVNGGGFGGPDFGPAAVPLHTDAVEVAGWETFKFVFVDNIKNLFALQTANGCFLTADHGGGIGGPDDATCPIHTDSQSFNSWETLTFEIDLHSANPTVSIRTFSGKYITAVGGGGIVKHSTFPIQTNRVQAGAWEHFSIQKLNSRRSLELGEIFPK